MVNMKDVAAGKGNVGYTLTLNSEGIQPSNKMRSGFSALERGSSGSTDGQERSGRCWGCFRSPRRLRRLSNAPCATGQPTAAQREIPARLYVFG